MFRAYLTTAIGVPILSYTQGLLKHVNRLPLPNITRSRAVFSRALALLLLSLIVYGTTVEAAHRHGNVAARANSGQSAPISSPETDTGLQSSLTGCSDCLICQLQHDFSTSLAGEREDGSSVQIRFRSSPKTSALFSTRIIRPHAGRAPPFTS